MGSLNRTTLIGRLGRDPELRHTQSGKAVCNFSLATNEKKNGEDYTEWHDITCWDKLAENCLKYLSKGRQAYVEGSIRTQEWQDKDGNYRKKKYVSAWNVVFLGGGEGGGTKSQSDGTNQHAEDYYPF